VYHLQQWAAVQELHRKGISIRGIARQLEMSRNTVRKLLKAKEEPHYQRSCYSSRLDPYKDQIREWRCRPYEFNGTRIFRELKARGYDGSIGPVYRYLRRIDEDTNGLISSKATVRVETPPGDQAQFDWSPYQMEIGGRIQKVYCFSMILACSRKKAILFSLKDDADAIYEAIQELFEDLGGVTLELLIDNPKALVLENNPKSQDEVRYHPHALLLAKHLSTELNACPCYWPRKKGKVERKQQRLMDEAGFEYQKSLDQINYTFNPSLDPEKIRELRTLRFMDAGENILIIGPPGVGKTMIATGIGMEACHAGKKVLFTNANDLMDRLTESMQNGTLKMTFQELQKIPLLIIDELSYLKMDKEKESLLFQVVRQRYEKSSLIITTNLPR
jgi:DNA replication protein DnaC